jgi:serine/threonine-protein kinase SRPK3
MPVYQPYDRYTAEENIARYVPGGYHPVTPGDMYNANRYEVMFKLGYGAFSTVWLGKDHG